jgi:hypothetical protein
MLFRGEPAARPGGFGSNEHLHSTDYLLLPPIDSFTKPARSLAGPFSRLIFGDKKFFCREDKKIGANLHQYILLRFSYFKNWQNFGHKRVHHVWHYPLSSGSISVDTELPKNVVPPRFNSLTWKPPKLVIFNFPHAFPFLGHKSVRHAYDVPNNKSAVRCGVEIISILFGEKKTFHVSWHSKFRGKKHVMNNWRYRLKKN